MDTRKQDQIQIYQIKIKGCLDDDWSDWFEGMTLSIGGDGNTLLEGPVVDQAALYGFLKRIHQFGLQLISINKVEKNANDDTQRR
jgi:hypothetical protein